jgi:CheY-like chemotaxis protein
MGKGLVLVVEDSPIQSRLVVSIVQAAGQRAYVVTNGLEALQFIETELPDVIILDVHLPKMDGFQVCQRLKRDPRTASIPVIMLTASDNAKDTLHGLALGADDYIPKDSFAMEHLTTTLTTYFAHGKHGG